MADFYTRFIRETFNDRGELVSYTYEYPENYNYGYDVADALGGRDDLRYCGFKCVIERGDIEEGFVPEADPANGKPKGKAKGSMFSRLFGLKKAGSKAGKEASNKVDDDIYKLGVQIVDRAGVSHIWWDEERGFSRFPE